MSTKRCPENCAHCVQKKEEQKKMDMEIPENKLWCKCTVQAFLNMGEICQNCGMRAKKENFASDFGREMHYSVTRSGHYQPEWIVELK